MTTQPTLVPGAGAQPWQERQLGYGPKLLAMFGFALLTMIALTSGITLIAVTISTLTVGTRWTGDFWVDAFPFLLALGVVLVSGFGAAKLYPFVSAPNRFTPSYGPVPATLAGQPFEVRFLRPRW